MKTTLLSALILFTIQINFAQNNTTFNNVSIGTDGPAYGVKIKANFPGVTGGWARAFSITNETDNQTYISLGSLGGTVNGVSYIANSYIGKNYDDQYMTFLPNGNIGIGTTNPAQKLEVNGSATFNGAIISSSSDNSGGVIQLRNPSKTSNGLASTWMIYNMTGGYGNSLQFWAYDNIGCAGGMCTNRFTIMDNGNVGIGTTNPTSKLTVAGNIASREVKVTVDAGADFVFEKDYDLPSLESVDKFIKENKHLPEIASAAEMKKEGMNLSEMNIKLLQKIEELTLYTIEQNKRIEAQAKEIDSMKDLALRVARIENGLSKK